MTDLDQFRYAPAKNVEAADRLLNFKKTKPVWDVIEECFRIWSETKPKEWKAYIVEVDNVRKTRKVTKGRRGLSKDKDGSYLNYTLDIPMDIMYMIRVLYTPDELPMDKAFFNKFAKCFPKFKVSEKI